MILLQDRYPCSSHRAVFKNAFLQMRIVLSTVLASVVGYTEKSIEHERLAPDSLIYRVLTTLPMGSSWAMFFSRTTVRSLEVLVLFLLFIRLVA